MHAHGAYFLSKEERSMKLYFSPGACSLSPHIVLREAGIDFTTERVDLRAKVTESGADFRAINPKGQVPALQLDDGTVLTEGAAIVQYIADRAGAAALLPAVGTVARYQVIGWLNYIGAELHKPFGALFTPGTSEEVQQASRTALATRFDYVAKALEGRDYLMGSEFTAADAYLFTVLGWPGYVKLSLADWPVLQAYIARVGARPAVQEAMRAEGLVK
jgi:glutathione S-transferase